MPTPDERDDHPPTRPATDRSERGDHLAVRHRMPTWRIAAVAALVTIAVAAIAMAATHNPLQVNDRPDRARISSNAIGSAVFAALGVIGLAATALLIWASVTGRRPGQQRKPKPWWHQVLSTLMLVVLFIVLSAVGRRLRDNPPPRDEGVRRPAEQVVEEVPERPPPDRGDDRWAALLGAAAAMVALGAIAFALRERNPREDAPGEDSEGDAVAAVLDDATDDVLNELDPRRAIVAAFVRMERGLSELGMPRRRSETAVEYVGRVLSSFPDPRGTAHPAISRLTELYLPARYSEHEMPVGTRDEAITALRTIRDAFLVAA